MSQSQIEVLYGTPPMFKQLKWPEKNSLELANPKAYLTIMGQFEMYKTVVICQVVHFMRSYTMTGKTGMQFTFDLQESWYKNFVKYRESEEIGNNFHPFFSQPEKFIVKQPDLAD